MRWLVWCGVASALAACGRSRSHVSPVPVPSAAGAGGGGATQSTAGAGVGGASVSEGGAGESGGGDVATGGSAVAASGHAGAEVASGASGAGGTSGTAGRSALGGSAGNGGGAAATAGTSASGGSGGMTLMCASDDAGASGAAGAGELECGEYVECGCGGCCDTPTTPLQSRCYFPELGETMAELRCMDQMEAAAPSCRNQPCSSGLRHVCCVSGGNDETAAAGYYTAQTSYQPITGDAYLDIAHYLPSGEILGIVLKRSTDGSIFPLTVPAGWALWALNDDFESGGSREVVGALGSIAPGAGPGCTLTLDFTLFALDTDGQPVALPFKAKDVAVSDSSACDGG